MIHADFLISILMWSFPRSTEDWQVGDLAICISEEWIISSSDDPKKDDLLKVTGICWDGRFLHFRGKPADRHWQAINFRKVTPDTSAADEEAWVETLQRFRKLEPA